MSKHTYEVKRISSDEYQVLEYPHGLETDQPFVLAKCSGPVPANDILVAMCAKQALDHKIQVFEKMRKSLASDFSDEIQSLETVLRKFRCVPESEGAK